MLRPCAELPSLLGRKIGIENGTISCHPSRQGSRYDQYLFSIGNECPGWVQALPECDASQYLLSAKSTRPYSGSQDHSAGPAASKLASVSNIKAGSGSHNSFLINILTFRGRFFVGGVVEEFDDTFNRVVVKICPVRVYDEAGFNESNNSTIEALIKNFCVAFEIGPLPSDLKLDGLIGKADEPYDDTPIICPGIRRARTSFESEVDGGGCEFCQNYCKHFPIAAVCDAMGVRSTYRGMRGKYCIRESVQLDILSKRRGWKEYTSQFYAPLEMVLRRSFSNTNYKDYTTVGGIPLLKFEGFLTFRSIPHDIFSLKQRYEDDGPDCKQLISEMISKYGFKPGTIPSQRLAQIIAETEYQGTLYRGTMDKFAEVFVDAKTLQVLSSFGFKVDNLMEFDKDRLPHFTPRTKLELISDYFVMEHIRCGSTESTCKSMPEHFIYSFPLRLDQI